MINGLAEDRLKLAEQISKIADQRLEMLGDIMGILDDYIQVFGIVLNDDDLEVYKRIDKELNGENHG